MSCRRCSHPSCFPQSFLTAVEVRTANWCIDQPQIVVLISFNTFATGTDTGQHGALCSSVRSIHPKVHSDCPVMRIVLSCCPATRKGWPCRSYKARPGFSSMLGSSSESLCFKELHNLRLPMAFEYDLPSKLIDFSILALQSQVLSQVITQQTSVSCNLLHPSLLQRSTRLELLIYG